MTIPHISIVRKWAQLVPSTVCFICVWSIASRDQRNCSMNFYELILLTITLIYWCILYANPLLINSTLLNNQLLRYNLHRTKCWMCSSNELVKCITTTWIKAWNASISPQKLLFPFHNISSTLSQFMASSIHLPTSYYYIFVFSRA